MNQSITPNQFLEYAENNPDSKVLGVLGNPISHSKSPLLHNAAYQRRNIKAKYFAIEIPDKKQLTKFLSDAEILPNVKGFNITIPFKTDVYELYPNEELRQIKAVNTLFRQNGKWISSNTDWIGFISPIRHFFLNSALILGWGGAASAVCYGLKQLNPQLQITAFSRRDLKPNSLLTNSVKGNYNRFPSDNKDYDLIINTTPLGMSSFSENFAEEFLRSIPEPKIAYDLIYNPKETAFLQFFNSKQAMTFNGLPMFLEQASHAHKLWFGELFSEKMIKEFTEMLP